MHVVTKQTIYRDGIEHGVTIEFSSEDRPRAIAFLNDLCARHEIDPGDVQLILDTDEHVQPRLTVSNPLLPYVTEYVVKDVL